MSIKKLVLLTGVGFDFIKGNATTNLTVNIGKAYEGLGYDTIIVPQNPSYVSEEKQSGSFDGIKYEFPLQKKNLFSGYRGIKRSLNYRLGILVNSLVTAKKIWRCRHSLSHVFSETLRPSNIFIIGLACRISGVKFVYHMVEEPWTLQRYSDMASWRLVFKSIESILGCIFLYSICLRLPNYIACISNDLSVLLRKLRYNKDKLIYLPSVRFNGPIINEHQMEYMPDSPLVKNSVPRIVYSGQISQTKESFIPVFDALKNINSQTKKVEFHIYGGGNSEAIESLKKTLNTRNVSEYVFYHGFVDRQELVNAQNSAMLCLLLKRDVPFNRFNFPTKLLDYLVARKAILLSDLPLHETLFTHKVDSIMVDPESVDEIEKALLWALDNIEELIKFGESGTIKLYEQFDATKNVKRLLCKFGF
ncbi:MAG: glycosyltransferase involved in cell wall biosynthesis [Francisellaceae bacterium]|jgi:glycosyltransferase involved in cell wall biosynthesis